MKAAVLAIAILAFCTVSGQARDLLAPSKPSSAPAPAPAKKSSSAPAPTASTTASGPSVATVAKSSGLTTLLQAVQLAGLTDTLSNPNADITVFAPTNAAFQKALGKSTLQSLQQQGQLKPLLLNHVVQGASKFSDLQKKKTAPSLSGGTLTFSSGSVSSGSSKAKVTKSDVSAGKAYVNVIDAVLQPATTKKSSG